MSVADWLDKPVRITREGVFFGDTPLPGIIAQDGVTVSRYEDSFNKLTVEFYVGEVIVDDPAVVETSENDASRFSVEVNPYADLKCDAISKGISGRRDLCEREYRHKGDHRADGLIWANGREGAYE